MPKIFTAMLSLSLNTAKHGRQTIANNIDMATALIAFIFFLFDFQFKPYRIKVF